MERKDQIRNAIVEFAAKGAKSKFYFKDMLVAVKKTIPDASTKEIKDEASAMVAEGILELFSTGSTTMYGLKGKGISVENSGNMGG